MLDKTAAFLESEMKYAMKMPESDTHRVLFEESMQEVKSLRSLPEIVMLVGSARFERAFQEEAYRLALSGVIVLGKHVFKAGSDWPLDDYGKALIHAVQFRMADLANRIHVVNVDSY